MKKPAAIVGRFHDLKYLLGARIARVIIELPLEEAAKVTAAFGHPDPNIIVEVALARLKPETTIEAEPAHVEAESMHVKTYTTIEPSPARAAGLIEDKPPRAFAELSLPVQAALKCKNGAFQKFCAELEKLPELEGEDHAVKFVRAHCGVKSRADLNVDPVAAERWQTLLREFDFWMIDA